MKINIVLFLSILVCIASTPLYSNILTLSIPIIEQGGASSQERVENTFLRWLQAGGVDLIAVHTYTPTATIDELLQKVNGIVFMGDPSALNTESAYYKASKYIIDKVKEIYDSSEGKTKIPILSVGNDLTLLTAIMTNKFDYIQNNKIIIENSLVFQEVTKVRTYDLFKELDPEDVVNISTSPICANKLEYLITKENFVNTKELTDQFDLLATARSREIEYVAVIQDKKYPFYGISFHPEKIVFEQYYQYFVPDSFEAIKAARLIGNSFTFLARTINDRSMTLEDKEKYDFIDPYGPYPEFWYGTYQYIYNQTQ